MTSARFLNQTQAARLLGVSWKTFEKRRQSGDPLFQPDYIDPDSLRRKYNEASLRAALDEMGRNKVRGAA